MIGDRIKQARKAAGLSLRALAEKAGVSAMAISKYENNQSVPSSGVMLNIAKALSVRTEYFFRHVSVELENVNHREHEKLPMKEELKVRADVAEQLERWLMLEKFHPAPWSKPFELPPDLPGKISDYDEIETIATGLRKYWNLGMNPIPDLIDSLETKGIKVFITKYDGHKNFNGLSATVNGAPVVVVGKHWTGDRQRFTLAHELGHLVLHGRLSTGLDEETACHRFAGAFIVPKEMVMGALGERRTWLEPQELMMLKHEWGLSMQAWSYRAHHLGITSKEAHKEIWRSYLQVWKKAQCEPDPQVPQEKTRLFAQFVYRALAEDMISESKAAELMAMPLVEFHACRMLNCPDATDPDIAEKLGPGIETQYLKDSTTSTGTNVKRGNRTGQFIGKKPVKSGIVKNKKRA
ncbi:MAG: XRE family transcriptional regulator [Gammaproteobacteria bacterium]|nr:MAG: XRE family transcriptional regulator [Gammaproteobacteria bacterium]